MAQLSVGRGISLEWEAFGDPASEPLVLVMGLGAQMILWPDDFCRQLAAQGFYVVRFDNRDIGLSTKLHAHGVPNVPARLALRAVARQRLRAPYTLSDMADDLAALLDGLDLSSAHVVGMSMGGMIAQTFAIEHPGRVRSLVSFASSTLDHGLPHGQLAALRVLTQAPPREREAAIQHGVSVLRAIGSPAHFDPLEARRVVERGIARSTYRLGAARQLAAILAAPPRSPLLAKVRAPTTVLHGRLDPLLPLRHGEATARAIPGATLVVIDSLAHDIPRPLWSEMIHAIAANARRAHGSAPARDHRVAS